MKNSNLWMGVVVVIASVSMIACSKSSKSNDETTPAAPGTVEQKIEAPKSKIETMKNDDLGSDKVEVKVSFVQTQTGEYKVYQGFIDPASSNEEGVTYKLRAEVDGDEVPDLAFYRFSAEGKTFVIVTEQARMNKMNGEVTYSSEGGVAVFTVSGAEYTLVNDTAQTKVAREKLEMTNKQVSSQLAIWTKDAMPKYGLAVAANLDTFVASFSDNDSHVKQQVNPEHNENMKQRQGQKNMRDALEAGA